MADLKVLELAYQHYEIKTLDRDSHRYNLTEAVVKHNEGVASLRTSLSVKVTLPIQI